MNIRLKNNNIMFNEIKRKIKKYLPYDTYMSNKWKKDNPFVDGEFEWGKEFFSDKPFVGILYDIAHEHQYYLNACHDLQINYKVIDIRSSDWINEIVNSECEVFLVWPTIYKPIQKQFWDERLQILTKELKKKIFPTFDLLWLYESKRRTRDWLLVNKLPHPKTDVFFTKEDALAFVSISNFPIVCKTDQGASSSGVFIIKNLSQAKSIVSKAFRRGVLLKNRGINDRHQGYIIFQEYLQDAKEWRMIRVGESYFCRIKGKKGNFHSGSGDIVWGFPPTELLDKTKEVSEMFDVPNINIDYFETMNGKYLINEIHALWGGKVIKDYDLEGRYIWNDDKKKWDFEKGDFFKNRTANLRLEWIKEKWL